VIEGLDVARTIQALPIVDARSGDISGQRPVQAIYLESVTIRKTGGAA
jgi:hypothetical protein